jgi:nucleotide-binding universal stress UspA family protein
LVDDIIASAYDLVILSAPRPRTLMSPSSDSIFDGGLQRTTVDTLLVRETATPLDGSRGGIAVCLDGSLQSYGALSAGAAFAKVCERPLELVAVSEGGPDERPLLAAHLDVAARYARTLGVAASTHLMDGASTPAIVTYVRRFRPWLLALGRGHSESDSSVQLGPTAEELVRLAPCNTLVSGRVFQPAAA